MSTDYQIRRATLADTALVTAQRCAMFEAMGVATAEELQPMAVRFESWLQRSMRTGTYLGWFQVLADGTVVAGAGLMLIDWPPGLLDQGERRGYLFNVYTHPDHRRRGRAAGLVREAIEACRERHIRVLSLHASDSGRAVYEGLSFAPTNEMRLVLSLGDR
jgi:GNAT superfamily N-acetyltransferase